MFGWFKRKPHPRALAAAWDYETQPITHAYLSDADGRDFKVKASDFSDAATLVVQIDQAKRHKKKHRHLLEQLRALEVK